jgi:hypothetical protein
MARGVLTASPAVAVPAEAITTDHGVMLIEGEEALTALCPVQTCCSALRGERKWRMGMEQQCVNG